MVNLCKTFLYLHYEDRKMSIFHNDIIQRKGEKTIVVNKLRPGRRYLFIGEDSFYTLYRHLKTGILYAKRKLGKYDKHNLEVSGLEV